MRVMRRARRETRGKSRNNASPVFSRETIFDKLKYDATRASSGPLVLNRSYLNKRKGCERRNATDIDRRSDVGSPESSSVSTRYTCGFSATSSAHTCSYSSDDNRMAHSRQKREGYTPRAYRAADGVKHTLAARGQTTTIGRRRKSGSYAAERCRTPSSRTPASVLPRRPEESGTSSHGEEDMQGKCDHKPRNATQRRSNHTWNGSTHNEPEKNYADQMTQTFDCDSVSTWSANSLGENLKAGHDSIRNRDVSTISSTDSVHCSRRNLSSPSPLLPNESKKRDIQLSRLDSKRQRLSRSRNEEQIARSLWTQMLADDSSRLYANYEMDDDVKDSDESASIAPSVATEDEVVPGENCRSQHADTNVRTKSPRKAGTYWKMPNSNVLSRMVEKGSKQLIGWMVERERMALRRRRGDAWRTWSQDPILLGCRFCNLRREDDRVTRVIQETLESINEEYKRNPSDEIASSILMSLITWRFFGSETFVKAVGVISHKIFNDGGVEEERLLDAMMGIALKRQHCFTDAYRPAQFLRNCEKKFRESPTDLRLLYESCFRSATAVDPRLKSIHKMCQADRLVHVAKDIHRIVKATRSSTSVESLSDIVAEVPGMGLNCVYSDISTPGSRQKRLRKRVPGFSTKELVQDLRLTPLLVYEKLTDSDNYCPIGPGAVKGLRLLMGLSSDTSILRTDMEKLLRRFHRNIRLRFPTSIQSVKQKAIRLHEVQSALCEVSKYVHMVDPMRRGKFRRFAPSDASATDVKDVNKLLEMTFARRKQNSFFDFGTCYERKKLHKEVHQFFLGYL